MMNSVACFVDYSVEPVVVVSGVMHSAYCAIRFHQAVRPLDEVTVSTLPLAFLVSCVGVMYSVVESVARICLLENGGRV